MRPAAGLAPEAMPRRLTLRQREQRFPPIFIRLVVTRGQGKERHAPDDRALANACGLTLAEFKFVAYSTSWRDIPDRLKYAFLMGCDVDLERRRCIRRLEWMRQRGTFTHLRKSPLWEPQFSEMVDLYAESSQ